MTIEEDTILLKPNEERKLILIIDTSKGEILSEFDESEINILGHAFLTEPNKNEILNLKTTNKNKIEFLAEFDDG